MKVWVWRTTDPYPTSPILSVAPFAPLSSGSRWAIGNRGDSFFDDFRVESPARGGRPCSNIYYDDFNRAVVGPNWQTCGDVSIASDSLRFINTSGGANVSVQRTARGAVASVGAAIA
jgi:hypothetical protein